MNKEKHKPNFDINTKDEDIINNSKKIAELHEFVSDGSCEPPSYICLAYDVKNYLPRLIKENQELKEQLEVGKEQYNDLVEEKEKIQEQLSSNTLQFENQQKEFIEWLEKEIKETDKTIEMLCDTNSCRIPYLQNKNRLLKEILKKYKEIVGYKE